MGTRMTIAKSIVAETFVVGDETELPGVGDGIVLDVTEKYYVIGLGESDLFRPKDFAERWGQILLFPIGWGNDDFLHTTTPTGWPCSHCEICIEENDRGMFMMHHDDDGGRYRPAHYACFLDAIGANPDAPVCPKCGGRHTPREDREE